ncbi:predicted protein [Naegleria gruberi]|uniref:Predicted protein n=1 Tax=Naegleria gruberi TaxID=5762 RepID=D2V8X4_NAEGR|nr:uncharacterized protein NAEGRDRAFT_65316 [Naegleria gruberi]EFC46878.1 predicted protein [Naegleria gruberi]|eukprot:XP_002679622.1 predicted protein [Naegleria gruberi strain NEG-M]
MSRPASLSSNKQPNNREDTNEDDNLSTSGSSNSSNQSSPATNNHHHTTQATSTANIRAVQDDQSVGSPPVSPRSPNGASSMRIRMPPPNSPGSEQNRKSFRLAKSPLSARSNRSNGSGNGSNSGVYDTTPHELKPSNSANIKKRNLSRIGKKDSPSLVTIPSSSLWINSAKNANNRMSVSYNNDQIVDMDEYNLTSSALSVKFSFEMLRNRNALLQGGMGRYFSMQVSKTGSSKKETEKIPLSVGCFVLNSEGKLVDIITVEQAKSLLCVENILNLKGMENVEELDQAVVNNVEESGGRKSKKSAKANSALTTTQTPLVALECQLNDLLSDSSQRKYLGMRSLNNSTSANSTTTSSSGKTTIGGFVLRTNRKSNADEEENKQPEKKHQKLSNIVDEMHTRNVKDDMAYEKLKQSFNIQVRDWKTNDETNYQSSGIFQNLTHGYAADFNNLLNSFTMSTTKVQKQSDDEEEKVVQKEDFKFCKKTIDKVMLTKYDVAKSKRISNYLSDNPFGEYTKLIFFLEGDLNCLEGDIQVSFENDMVFTKSEIHEENAYRVSASKFIHNLNIEVNQPSLMNKSNTITTLFSLSYDRLKKEYKVDLADPLSSINNSSLSCQPFPLPNDSCLFHLPKVLEPIRENHNIVLETRDVKSNSPPKAAGSNNSIFVDSEKLRLRITEENRAIGIRPIRTNHFCVLMDSVGGVVDVVSHDKRFSNHTVSGEPTISSHMAVGVVGNNNSFESSFDYFDLKLENLKHIHEIYFVSMIGDGYEHSELPRMGLTNTASNNISSYLFFDSSFGLSYIDKSNNEVNIRNFPTPPHPSNCIIWGKVSHATGQSFVMKFLGEHMSVEKKPKQTCFSTIVRHIRHYHFNKGADSLCRSAVVQEGQEITTYDFPVKFSNSHPIMLQFQGASHPHLCKPSDLLVKLTVFTFDKEAYFLKKQHVELRREGPILDGVIDPMAIIPRLVEKAGIVFCIVSYREHAVREDNRTVTFEDEDDLPRNSVAEKEEDETIRNIFVIDPVTRKPLFSLPLCDIFKISNHENNGPKEVADFEGYKHLLAFKMERKQKEEWSLSYVGEWMPIDVDHSSVTKRDDSWVYYLSDLFLMGDSKYKRVTNERLSHAPIPSPSQYICFGVRLEDTTKKVPFRSDLSPLTAGTTKKAQKTKNLIDHTIVRMKAICYNWKGDVTKVLSSSNSMPKSGSVEKYLADDSTKFAALIDRALPTATSVQWPMQGEYDETQCYMMLDSVDDSKVQALSPSMVRLSFRRNKDFMLPEPIPVYHFSILLKIYIVINSKEIPPEDVIELLSQLNAVIKVYNMETKSEAFRFTIPASQIPYKAGENQSKINSHLFLCSIRSIFSNDNSSKVWHINPILQRKQMGGELTKFLAPIPKILKVQIVEARNLPVMDAISGLCDGFVKVYNIENEKGLTSKKKKKTYKTKTIKKNLNPRWNNETFTL